MRYKAIVGAVLASLENDYMPKDHLGNVRMVLTEEQQQKTYPAATFENATVNGSNARAEEIKYYDIDQSKIVANPPGTATYANNNGNPPYNTNPYSNTTATTGYMYKTNASANKTGLGIVLKVMAGDNVNIYGVSYHKKPTGGSYTTPVSSLSVSDIINAFVGTGIMAPKGISGSTITGASGFPTSIANLIGSQPAQTADLPRASINWIVLDEQFKHVAGGFDMANGTSGSLKFHTISTIPTIPITKNGYIYVYVSNESNYDVFFDNLQVIHTPGPILEETHYYPFGLAMAGISSKAMGSLKNKKGYNGNELQSNEFNDNSGLELYDFNARTYDQQIGRFIQVDPMADEEGQESLTPYQFGLNNAVRYDDPDGKCPPCIAAMRIARLVKLVIRLSSKVEKNPTSLPIAIKDATTVIKTIPINFPITKNQSTDNSDEVQQKAENLQSEIKNLDKSINSLEKNVKEHKEKLKEYKNDPDKFDNKEILKDASPEIREKIINGRIKELERQVQKNEGELQKAIDKKAEKVNELNKLQ